MTRLAVTLSMPATEMACEEIVKQVAYLSNEIRNVGFDSAGATLECDVPVGEEERLERDIRALAERMQRSLRKLERKVVYRSTRADRPAFAPRTGQPGVHVLGRGQVALEGLPLALFQYFDRTLARIGERWDARPILTPTLIPAAVLARCDYFRSFPQSVTFACHLHEELTRIDDFRSRHTSRDDLDERATADMATPEACLSPQSVTTSITSTRSGRSARRGRRTRCAGSVSAMKRGIRATSGVYGTSRCAKWS